jgi:alanine racemase
MNKPASIDRASDIDQASAVLTIDLGAVRENYRGLRARVRSAECSAVVKADAYGLGAVEIASALLKEGCRTFFVAHGTEGVSLRQAVGYGPAIHVLNGLHPGTEQICAEAGLTAVANSQAQLAAWKAAARRLGRRLPVSVHVDTGMSRLGMPAEEVERLSPADFDGLDLTLVMSHLACAEETGSPTNELQRLAFESLRRKLPKAPASLANSSGVFLGDDFHFDMVRPGAALFGVNPTPHVTNPMREVVRLSARVIQTRDLGVGVGIGYGHTYRTNVPIRTVTIALGYADGWPRRAAGAAFYAGKRLPFIGRVSMDSIVLDGSSLSAGELRIGEFVEVISDGQTVDDIAGLSGTIGYEILTGLGSRYLRRYTGG